MPSKRIKAESFRTRIDFEIAVDRISYAQIELRNTEVTRDEAVLQVQQAYGPAITELQDEIKTKVTLCEKYALEHRAELLPDEKRAKSAETVLARYGFRTGMPVLKLLSKGTWEKVTDKLRALGKMKFVRVSYETDKQALLTAQTTEDLSALGVKVVQGEAFYIEPKAEGAEAVKGGAS